MKIKFAIFILALPFLALAQNPVGASSSGKANEVATNTAKPVIEYVNAAKDGARVVVTAGEIKSANSNFTQKVTSNATADFGELELSRANFKITKNQLAELFFSNLKSEKIKKRIYKTTQEARSEVFEYIEGFYNPVRRHKHLDQLSPLEFERRQIAL